MVTQYRATIDGVVMPDPIRVSESGYTNVASWRGKRGSSTASPVWAAELVASKVFPDARRIVTTRITEV